MYSIDTHAFTDGALPSREDIPEKFKWRLSDIYASQEDWELDFERVKPMTEKLAAMRGSLGASAENLLSCLRLRDGISEIAGRLYSYAVMKSHEDTADPRYQALSNKAALLSVEVSSAASFITPEIIAIPGETLRSFTEDGASDFSDYLFELSETVRRRAHILSEAEEVLLAQSGDMAGAPEEAFSMLTDADMKFPDILDENGRPVELSDERYIKYIASRDRAVREDAFTSLYETYKKYTNTIGATFGGMLKGSRFYSRARKFGTDLEYSLDGPNIPVSVYDNLVGTIEANLAPLHRYMSLRKAALGAEELHMYDLYAPLAESPYSGITWDEAVNTARGALGVLGDEYVSLFDDCVSSGWIDVCASRGKRGGAYSWGVYGVHPFILLNYNGEWNDVSTLAHEAGHAIHSFYSHKNQPYATSDYTTFCAEIASTTNEELLTNYMLRTTDDRVKRIYLLNQRLEHIRATVYRQTMFASFEREVHERFRSGQDVTSDAICKLWLSLNEKYYGPDIVVDKLIAYEWSRIPHFYSPFYVFQYATGYSAAAALAKMITEEGEEARGRYIKFLSGGGSANSIDLLRGAGVDMSTPKPILDLIEIFKKTLDEIEGLI
ncbi:oligoendopeptidase F [Synergistales bacterium]|nr:oligoendopeptidase F [Synergistales bacterium]